MREEDAYQSAVRRALARKPFLKTDGRYLSREEVHERPAFVDTNIFIYALGDTAG
jgi:hypothetical protein